MSILKSTNSGKCAYWHMQLEHLCEKIDKILSEKDVTKKNPLVLHYECPIECYDLSIHTFSTTRYRVNFWNKQLISTKETLEQGFANAVSGTMFNVEDISLENISLTMQEEDKC